MGWAPSIRQAGLVALLWGCGADKGDVSEEATEEASRPVTGAAAIPEAMLDGIWAVHFSTVAKGQLEDQPAWVTVFIKRNYPEAARIGAAGGLGRAQVARFHADAAAVYRQAVLLSAHAILQVYGEDPRPTDPVGAAHLLTLSHAVLGDLDAAREAADRMRGVADDPTGPWHAPWRAWIDAGAVWPPDLSALPLDLPEVSLDGRAPVLRGLPHYQLPEQGTDSLRDMADPGALLAVAFWHDQASALAGGEESVAMMKAYRAPYRLPVEPEVLWDQPLPIELLPASDLLHPWDAAFLAAVTGSQGAAAVDAYQDRSLVAHAAMLSRVDGKVNAERATDLVTDLRARMLERMRALNDGQVDQSQRMFADVSVAALFRSLGVVAEVEGTREVSGRMFIHGLDRDSSNSKRLPCPVGSLGLAAWDASNRYPVRALDIVHKFSRGYPSLEVARYSADLLGLRVSRERPGESAGM
jgi:hypothetical protein